MKTHTPLIDIGVNLMHRSFHGDRDQVVQHALEQQVSPLVITGTSLRNSQDAARYAARYPRQLYATAGIHPQGMRPPSLCRC